MRQPGCRGCERPLQINLISIAVIQRVRLFLTGTNIRPSIHSLAAVALSCNETLALCYVYDSVILTEMDMTSCPFVRRTQADVNLD